jgi:hypothetical protein
METYTHLINVRDCSYLVSYNADGDILQTAMMGRRVTDIEWEDIPPFDQEFIQRFVFNQLFNQYE